MAPGQYDILPSDSDAGFVGVAREIGLVRQREDEPPISSLEDTLFAAESLGGGSL